MAAHEYKPGDRVIVSQHGKPVRAGLVSSVKSYKRKAKIALADGSEWDDVGSRWGAGAWDTWHMAPMTEDGYREMVMAKRRAAVAWVADNWSLLTDEQRTEIGDMARAVRTAAKVAKP